MKNSANSKKKILIGTLTPVAALLLAFLILCIVTMSMFSPTYLGRVLTHWDSDVSDYKLFPARTIGKSGTPYSYSKNVKNAIGDITVEIERQIKPLKELILSTDTTSFIVIKNDEIVYEQYANGYNENSVNTSFSMAKSVVSLLIGKAVEDGYIASVKQPISDYITEFDGLKIGENTIEDLLIMRSNIVYEEDKFLWFGDDSLTYWYDDLQSLALKHTDTTDKYNGKFHYNNYHPLLLGIILQRSTHVSVSEYFEREIWQKSGAEYEASWSLDGSKSGFEKLESGINFKAIDFAKIGSLVLHGGFWNGTQIISKDWLQASTICDFPLNNNDYANTFLEAKNIGYKYMWYCAPSPQSGYDVFAWGKSDQILFISPAHNTVVLRTGKSDGKVWNWASAIQKIITQINGI